MSLEEQYNRSEEEANEILSHWDNYVYELRNTCAKLGVLFSTPEDDCNYQVTLVIEATLDHVKSCSERGIEPLKSHEIARLISKILLDDKYLEYEENQIMGKDTDFSLLDGEDDESDERFDNYLDGFSLN